MQKIPTLSLVFLIVVSIAPTAVAQEAATESPGDQAACICPKEGVWRITNLEGWMECSMLGLKRKLKGKARNQGAIWILDENCSSLFSEAYKRKREDVLMERGENCNFYGLMPGEEEGAEVIFDGAYTVESEEFISGEFYLDMSGFGNDCEGYRPFEVEFVEPLGEKDYAKLEKQMEKKLALFRETLEEHRDMLDEYLEKTDGGRAGREN